MCLAPLWWMQAAHGDGRVNQTTAPMRACLEKAVFHKLKKNEKTAAKEREKMPYGSGIRERTPLGLQ